MIKSSIQARLIQERRFKAGKKGTSKAVRRYFKRIYGESGFIKVLKLPSDFSGCRRFDQVHESQL